MNILIIGGSGGLSGCLARKALQNNKVWTLTRGQRKLPDGVIPLVADRNSDDFEKVIMSAGIVWDVVFDCICMNAAHAKQDLEIIKQVTDRLVVISTDSVYDPAKKDTPQKEDGFFLEGDTYAGNKRAMEKVFLDYFEKKKSQEGLNVTIYRPGHIYGPGFLLGCYPEHSRQKELPDLILQGKTLKLVASGIHLTQPIFVEDLADAMLDCVDKERTFNQIFCIGGPKAVENREYYRIIADLLGQKLRISEIPLEGYLEKYPQYDGHLCHRIYDMIKLREAGVKLPATSLEEGIRMHLASLGYLD